MKTRSSAHEQRQRQFLWGAAATAILVIIGLTAYFLRPRPTPPTENRRAELPAVLTPESFQNIVGPITAIQPNGVTVQMTINHTNGQSEQRLYRVSVNPETEILLYIDKPTGVEIQPATLKDLRSGDLIGAAAQQNLRSVTAFTATKIYKIISS